MKPWHIFLFFTKLLLTECTQLLSCAPKCECYNKEMECIEEELTDVPRLHMGTFVELLDLSFNNIEVLFNNSFQDFPKIRDIYLNSAQLKWLEINAFHGLSFLEKLDLSNNYIEYIDPNIFESNENLHTVILSKNMLLIQDEPILISSSVKVLDISHCDITYLTQNTLSGLPALQTLDLSDNSLSYLSPDTFASLGELNFTDVSNNDWKCDHNFDTLMCWIYQHTTQHDKLATTFCYDKEENKQAWRVKSCQHPTDKQSNKHATKCNQSSPHTINNDDGWFLSQTIIQVTLLLIMLIGGAILTGRWIVKKCATPEKKTLQDEYRRIAKEIREPNSKSSNSRPSEKMLSTVITKQLTHSYFD